MYIYIQACIICCCYYCPYSSPLATQSGVHMSPRMPLSERLCSFDSVTSLLAQATHELPCNFLQVLSQGESWGSPLSLDTSPTAGAYPVRDWIARWLPHLYTSDARPLARPRQEDSSITGRIHNHTRIGCTCNHL